MKKQVIALLAVAAMLGLTACGESEKNDNKVDNAIDVTVTEDALNDEATEEAETEAVTEAETVAVPTELSDKYADLDNRSFKYNGHLLTLGVSTLQDVLDAGAELDQTEDGMGFNYDIKYDRVFEGDLFYDTFEYKLKGTGVVMNFANLTYQPIALRECVLLSVSAMAFGGIPDELEFSFDKSFTAEELLANSGEPTYVDDKSYETEYAYKVVSEKYPTEDSGYTIAFDNHGKLSMVIISLIPENDLTYPNDIE